MNSDWTTVINKRDKQKGNNVVSEATVSEATVSEAVTVTEDTNPLSYRNMLLKNIHAIPKKETPQKEKDEEDNVEQRPVIKQWSEFSIAEKKISIAKAKEKKKLAEAYKLSRKLPIPTKFRPINKRDYTLSEKEEKSIVKAGVLDMCCVCCSIGSQIKKIIKRPFTSCHTCYCCVGDNPQFDDRNLCIYVNPELNESIIFWDANCPNKYYETNKNTVYVNAFI
jgi:hypothetical protein